MTKIKQIETDKTRFTAQSIAYLEELLAMAHAGEITELACVYLKTNGEIGSTWSGTNDMLRLLGGASRLVHRLNLRVDEANV